jgi:hypothetical protein
VSTELSEFTIREYQPGDETGILASLNRIFAAVDPSFVPRSLAHWCWQYRENPSGARMLIAVAADGTVAGHFGDLLQRVWLEGEAALFGQGVDHFADPAYRRGLRRGSLLALLGNTIAERVGGSGPERDSIMWGAPVPAAWRVGKTMVKYELIRTQLKLVAEPGSMGAAAAPGVELEELSEFPADVADLCTRAAPAFGAMAVRDKAQLDWRFVRHPLQRYTLVAARRGAGLVGYAVWRVGDFDGEQGEGLLCDWLVQPGDAEAGNALLAWAAERSRAAGVERLTTFCADSAPDWIVLQRAGFLARPSRYFIIGRNYVKRLTMRWLHRRWYYTIGDTDLV